MILETIRIVTDWLNGSTYGVAPLLADLPLDGSDARPTAPTIVDETRDGPAARRKIAPAEEPALVVRQADPAELNGEPFPNTGPRDAVVHLAIWYGDKKSASEQGNQAAHYVLRAAAQSLRLLTGPTQAATAAAVAAKTRNNVQLLHCQELRLVSVHEPLEDSIFLGVLLVTYKVRDLTP